MHSFDYDEIVTRLTKRTQYIVEHATGDDLYQRLKTRFEQLHGMLELARLLGNWRLARRIETHIEALRPVLDEG